jgi:hypothetical protein
MSFRDTPITKNCDVVDVMGRRIATSTARKASVGQETVIENWQPFQINGRRVTPCRLYVNTFENATNDDHHMPEINGVPIDEPGARINWVGDVYLSVKMVLVKDEFGVNTEILSIDPDVKPVIESVSKGDKLVVIYTGVSVVGDYDRPSISGDGWVSWKIGRIQNASPRVENYLRYFTGHDESWNGYDVENGPIYKKGDAYPGPPKEWGLAFVYDRQFTEFAQIPKAEVIPEEEEAPDPNFSFSETFPGPYPGQINVDSWFDRMTVGVGNGQYSVPTFIVLVEERFES